MVHSYIPWSKSWRKVGQGGSEGCLDLLCSPRREQAEATNARSAMEEKYDMRVVRSTRVGSLRGPDCAGISFHSGPQLREPGLPPAP